MNPTLLDRHLRPKRPGRRVTLLRRQNDPTDAIYIERPLKELARAGAVTLRIVDFGRGWSPRRLGSSDALIVSRYLTADLLEFILENRGRFGRIVYLFDDDLAAAAATEQLHEPYRRWIAPFAEEVFPRLLELADQLVVTSAHLQERYGPKADLLEPVFALGEPDAPPEAAAGEAIRILCVLTTTHHYDLAAIAPGLEELARRRPRAEMLLVGCEPPPALAARPNVRHMPQMPWPRYRRFLRRERASIGLAPLLDTPWNRGKSFIKLIDCAYFGAVPVCSRGIPYNRVVEHGESGLLLENTPEAWLNGLEALLERPERIRPMAEANRRRMMDLANPERAVAYWRRLLA